MIKPTVLRPSSEMNITPMIDVLLVLLVIFMAALPLSQRGLDANLPSAAAPPATPIVDDRIMLEYFEDRRIEINRQPIALADLETQLREIFRDRRSKTLYIAGHGSLRYGEIIAVIDAGNHPTTQSPRRGDPGKGAGVDRVGIVTEGMRRAAARR